MQPAYFLLVCLLILGNTACKKEKIPLPNNKSEKKILEVSFAYSLGQAFTSTNTYIDEAGKRIFIHPSVFTTTNKDIYEVRFIVSPGATVTPASDTKLDLSTPVTVTVTAEDGSKEQYRLIRSLVELQATSRYPTDGTSSMIYTINSLTLEKERGVYRNSDRGTLNLFLGEVNPSQVISNHFSMRLSRGAAQSPDFVGSYGSADISNVAIVWGAPIGYITVDEKSQVTITSYDPVMRMYSGKIEHLQATYAGTPENPTHFIRTTGYFENIPLME